MHVARRVTRTLGERPSAHSLPVRVCTSTDERLFRRRLLALDGRGRLLLDAYSWRRADIVGKDLSFPTKQVEYPRQITGTAKAMGACGSKDAVVEAPSKEAPQSVQDVSEKKKEAEKAVPVAEETEENPGYEAVTMVSAFLLSIFDVAVRALLSDTVRTFDHLLVLFR
jgi:hypothetical protein